MSEDLPDKNNRVTLKPDGAICVHWKPNNLRAHERLIATARKMLRRAGYPVILTQRMGIATNSQQCGTLRFGKDPTNSVLNTECQTHDIDNLYVVDSSFWRWLLRSTEAGPGVNTWRVARSYRNTVDTVS